jgi:hypothetical protein
MADGLAPRLQAPGAHLAVTVVPRAGVTASRSRSAERAQIGADMERRQSCRIKSFASVRSGTARLDHLMKEVPDGLEPGVQ